ncbi:hypothetical protein ACHHYP_20192 [Achlya hypogyna]|uniref:Adenylate cyclase-associated CAP C-terminal domain-containing protein n=1 Tax=Achlya hypogyna TaxID=1202772 RepID=A0A1V9Z058_ACHHY|nr:hypothetical protein ACHHYP_20192 [Achlya hypogyna]
MLKTDTLLATMRRRPQPVEYARRQGETIEVPPQTTGVFVQQCSDCVVVCPEKVTQIALSTSTGMTLRFVSVISSLEVLRCADVAIEFSGTCNTIVVEASNHLLVMLPSDSSVQIVSMASENLRLRNQGVEYTVPNVATQTVTHWNGCEFTSQPLQRM